MLNSSDQQLGLPKMPEQPDTLKLHTEKQITLRSKIKLLKVKSVVIRCSHCHTWQYRCPAFMFELDMDCCQKCGCTSVSVQQGRDYSYKSRQWAWVCDNFYDMMSWLLDSDTVSKHEIQDIQSTVVTDKPIQMLRKSRLKFNRVVHTHYCFRHFKKQN